MGIFDMFKKQDDGFEATSKFGVVEVNDKEKKFKIQGTIVPYSDLVSFELIEDGSIITEGGISAGRAILGGAFFGASGGGMGGLSKVNKMDKEYCTNMEILVTLKNQIKGTITIPFIIFKSDKSKAIYSQTKTNAKATISGLNYILDQSVDKTISEFDKLKKLKELYDLDILTEEEFLDKKKEILSKN